MNIVRIRKKLRLTQRQLGGLLGAHPMTVSKWERGLLQPNTHQRALLRRLSAAAGKYDQDTIAGVAGEPVRLLAELLNSAYMTLQEEVSMQISASNILRGKIVLIEEGAVLSRVVLEIAPKVRIVSVITSASIKRLKLKVGARAAAIIKATEVMIGKE